MSERTYYDGKYTVKARTDGGLEFLRYGEAWPAADALLRFNNLLGAMFREQLDADAEIAALRKALADYVRHTGIGSTLLPDVVLPSSGTMESEIAALKQRVADLLSREQRAVELLQRVLPFTVGPSSAIEDEIRAFLAERGEG